MTDEIFTEITEEERVKLEEQNKKFEQMYGKKLWDKLKHFILECKYCNKQFNWDAKKCECGNDLQKQTDEIIESVKKSKKKPLKKFVVKDNFVIVLDNYIPNIELFYQKNPFFYDKSQIFWFWNNEESKYEIKDETDVMNMLDDLLGLKGQTVTSSIKSNYMEAMKRVGRTHIPKDAPIKWIQFNDKAYSIKSGKIYDVEPNYFFTNPIPHELGETDHTPNIDKLFTEWVGKEYTQTLYEIIAYCCYKSYPIQTIICLQGSGRNGKSCFLKVLGNFLGKKNICSTELDLLTGTGSSRFESAKLYKKLVCQMGETNFGVMNKSSLLKKLTGGDLIGYEMKNKQPFDDYNYAKLIVSSNSLPSTDDTSEGFYRRWLIINFMNEFPEGKDIVETIPEYEYDNLARKICNILPKLIESGTFTNQGTIKERQEKYIMVSNPLPLFIQKYCERDPDSFVNYNELYTHYVNFLLKNKKRRVKTSEFKQGLENEGFWIQKTTKKIGEEWKNGNWIEGLKFCEICDNYAENLNSFPIGENQYRNSAQLSQKAQKTPNGGEIEEIWVEKPLSPEELVLENIRILSKKHHEITYAELITGLDFDVEKYIDILKSNNTISEIRSGVFVLL